MNKTMSLMISLSFTMMLLTLISRQQHILPTFMCLEGLMLFMLYYIPIMMNSQSMNTYSLIIIMLTVSVSSASVSLALMVMFSRKEGNDSTMLTSTHMC